MCLLRFDGRGIGDYLQIRIGHGEYDEIPAAFVRILGSLEAVIRRSQIFDGTPIEQFLRDISARVLNAEWPDDYWKAGNRDLKSEGAEIDLLNCLRDVRADIRQKLVQAPEPVGTTCARPHVAFDCAQVVLQPAIQSIA